MKKSNKFVKRVTTVFVKLMTIAATFGTFALTSCDTKESIELRRSDLVQKFMVANKCIDTYSGKFTNFLGQEKFLRCKVYKNEPVKYYYDDTFLPKEEAIIKKCVKHFNDVFSQINPEIQFVAEKVDKSETVGYPAKRNEIYMTKDNLEDIQIPDGIHTGGALGVSHGKKELSLDGEYYRIEQKIRINEDYFNETSRRTSKFFGGVVMHESEHCWGPKDVYLVCTDEEKEYLEQINGTIMFAGKEVNEYIGTNDFKLLCGLYGNYTESTLFAYKDKIEAYEKFIADYKKDYKENYDKEWEIACNIANGIYEKLENAGEKGYVDKYVDINDYLCLENTKTNEYYKFIGDETYSIYNKNTKTTQNLTYKDSYFLTKISDDKCLMAVDDNYLVCDTATEKVTTVLNKISLDQYNTAVGIKSTSTEPDLSM